MSTFSHSEYQLSLNEVYPRQAIYGFQLAPDNQKLSFIFQRDERIIEFTNKGQKRFLTRPLADLCLIPKHGGYPRQLTNSGDFCNPAVWSPDGQWLAFGRESGLQIMPASGGEIKKIYKDTLYQPLKKEGDAYLSYPSWSTDGKYILFCTREAHQTILHLVSKSGKEQRDVYVVDGYIIEWNWHPDRRRILVVIRREDATIGDVKILDANTNEILSQNWEEFNCQYQNPIAVWAPKGDYIVFRSNRSGWSKLYIATADGEGKRPLTSGEWDEHAFRFSPDGKQIVYASGAGHDGFAEDLWTIPLLDGEPKQLTDHHGINIPIAWSNDGLIYYLHSSPVEQADLWVISANGGEPERLTWSTSIELKWKMRAPKQFKIKNENGKELNGLIYLPAYYKEGEKYPAIVWIRGGPADVCNYAFNPFYNWLANQGFVVITPNYRGSIGFGVEYMNAVTGEGLGKSDLNDILSAGRYVKTLPFVDLTRGVGVGGESYGGYLALMAITQAPDYFTCAVAGRAIYDWSIQQAKTEVRYYDRWIMGGWVYEYKERARESSPVNFLERIKVPLLIYHGKEDRDVPFSQAESFIAKAKQSGLKIEDVAYPNEGHKIQKPNNQQDILDRIRDFFRRHLQPWNLHDNPCRSQVL